MRRWSRLRARTAAFSPGLAAPAAARSAVDTARRSGRGARGITTPAPQCSGGRQHRLSRRSVSWNTAATTRRSAVERRRFRSRGRAAGHLHPPAPPRQGRFSTSTIPLPGRASPAASAAAVTPNAITRAHPARRFSSRFDRRIVPVSAIATRRRAVLAHRCACLPREHAAFRLVR